MSWLFSRVLVEEYLGENSSDGEQCAPSSGNPTLGLCLPNDRMMEFLKGSRFGMTCEPLTESLGAELLTWFLEGSRAKTLVQLGRAPE